jgi:isorenieratene synthase
LTQESVSNVIIIGAGIAGLTAALHLAERGLRPLVLEADPQRPGGRLKGGPSTQFEHVGRAWQFSGEHGIHAIWSPYRNLQAMLARHRIRPVLVPAQEETWFHGEGRRARCAPTGTVLRGSWVPAPFHYLGLFARPRFWAMLNVMDFFSMSRVLLGLLAALSIDPFVEDRALPGFTLAQYCDKWTPKLVALFGGLARNFVPATLDQIPAAGFIAFLRFYTLRRRDAWAFSYLPDDGNTAIIAPMVATLQSLGGALRLGARVTRLEQLPTGWRVGWEEAGASQSAEATHVILATDAPAAEALLRAGPSTLEQASLLHLPIGTPTAIFRMWFDCAPRASRGCQHAEAGIFSGDFVLDNFFWLHRIYNEYIKWARATRGSALESHIYGPPELLEQADATLMAAATADVYRAWPELKGHLLHSTLARNPATHTLPNVGRPAEHLAIVTPWPRLFCCGDWVRDRNPALFMERACVTGIKAANAVLAECGQAPWLLLPPLEPEPLAGLVERAMRATRLALRRRVRGE